MDVKIYCYQSGHVGFGTQIPDGSLPVLFEDVSAEEAEALIVGTCSLSRKRGSDDMYYVPLRDNVDEITKLAKKMMAILKSMRKRVKS